jgi:antitoxin HicB
MGKELAYYKSLTYPTEIVREEDGIVVAFHPDLLGCVAQGESADEALTNLDEARAAWLEVRLKDHLPIPEPPDENYSGRVLVRMSPALHAAIAHRARRQGVSTNQFIVTSLAESLGMAKAVDYIVMIREEFAEALALAQVVPAKRAL